MATIQGVYIALFGRPADPAGLAFFNEQTNNGADLTAIGDLASTAEYQSRFEGMSNTQVINALYQSLFGRPAEAAGLEYFAAALEAGTLNINNIAIAILDGAQGDDKLVIDNKLKAANMFTESLDTATERQAYQGEAAADAGRAFLEGITKQPNSLPNQAATDAAIAAIVALDPGSEGSTPGLLISLTGAVDTVAPNVADPALRSTDGDDTIQTVAAGDLTTDSINGGAGVDTLAILHATAAGAPTMTNVEHVVADAAGAVIVNFAGVTGLQSLTSTDAAGNAFTNIQLGTELGVTGANGAGTAFGFRGATGNSDAATLKFASATGDQVVTLDGIENLTVNLTGSNVAQIAGTAATGVLTTLAITGTGNWDGDTAAIANAALTKVDASAASGAIALNLTGALAAATSYIGSQGIDAVDLGAGAVTVVYTAANVSTFHKTDNFSVGGNFTSGADKIDVSAFAFTGDKTAITTITTTPTTDVAGFFGANAVAQDQGGGLVYFDINNDGNFNADTDLVVNVGVVIADTDIAFV